MAKPNDWGLTDAGFRRPTYAELLDALEYKARELFGSKANLTVRSPLGVFLRIFAWVLNLLFSTLEDVYNSRFVDTAVGTSLLHLGRMIGIRLLGAQKAMGYLTFYGDDNVEVPEGFLAETTAGMQYVTLSPGVITNGSVTLPASAAVAGPDGNIAERTIKNITNPKLGIRSVINEKAFEGGRNTETDDEFRERYYLSVDFAGGVNLDAIIAEIYGSVEAVIAVAGEENDTDFESKVFNLVTDSKFPLDGIERIKRAVIQHIGVNTRGGLNIGQDVICVTLPTVVLKVPGVVDFDLQISPDGENFSWKNIQIAAREKAVTDESMVIVE